MQLLIDTSSPDLLLVLIDAGGNSQRVVHRVNFVQKAEILSHEIEQLLKATTTLPAAVQAIYVTLGPGAFMGARSGWLWAITFCLMTKAKLWVAPTFALLPHFERGAFWLPATKTASYAFWSGPAGPVHALVQGAPRQVIDYSHLLQNLNVYLARFHHATDMTSVMPFYYRRPQIGAT